MHVCTCIFVCAYPNRLQLQLHQNPTVYTITYILHIGISYEHAPVTNGTLMAGAPLNLRILLGGPPEVSVLSMRSRGATAASAHQFGLFDSVVAFVCTHADTCRIAVYIYICVCVHLLICM